MKAWKAPTDEHTVYEALSAIADGRFDLKEKDTAMCTSTSRGKFYKIKYDQATNSIMSNDNMAYYKDEISYPMVAMLLYKNEIEYDKKILEHLKNIKWKDINQRNKNDYMKSVAEILTSLDRQGVDISIIKAEVDKIYEYVKSKKLRKLGTKTTPPNAY